MSKAKKLHDALAKFLEGIRDADRQSCEEIGIEFKDPLADVKLSMGGTDYVYTTGGGEHIHSGESNAEVSLTFDGAGYDYFSYCSEGIYVPELGKSFPPMSEKYREQLDAIAKKHGYYFEDVTNWSLRFYPR